MIWTQEQKWNSQDRKFRIYGSDVSPNWFHLYADINTRSEVVGTFPSLLAAQQAAERMAAGVYVYDPIALGA